MKTAILIYSDPGSEEALGRCFTGMAVAYEAQQHAEEVSLIFGGAGVRWPGVLSDPAHPAHELFTAVKDSIRGVCASCTDVFGGAEAAGEIGIGTISEVPVPNGPSGLPSMRRLIQDGYTILSF